MKFLLVVAAFIAVAVASPVQRELITPDNAGPAPAPVVIEPNPGPTFAEDHVPVDFGPVPIDSTVPIVGPTPVKPSEIFEIPVNGNLIQIIVNINQPTEVSPVPVMPALPSPIVPDIPGSPVHVVDQVDVNPVEVIDTVPVVIDPINIGTPVLPSPAVILPDELN